MKIYTIKYELNGEIRTTTKVLQNDSDVKNGLPVNAVLISFSTND